MTTLTEKGSYDFATFSDAATELNRLKMQALQCWNRERELLLRSGIRPGMRVLDAGCGPGFVSAEIATLLGSGSIVGLEPDEALAAIAAKNPEPRFSVVEGSVYTPPVTPASFDFAYARLLFQHLTRPNEALRALYQTLKPGGQLAILDVDDALLLMEPTPKGLIPFTQTARAAQAASGGDRYIGRKLPQLLKDEGFEDVHFEVQSLTSEELGLDSFLKLISGYKLYISDNAQSAQLLQTLTEDALRLQAIGTVGIFFARGRKPL